MSLDPCLFIYLIEPYFIISCYILNTYTSINNGYFRAGLKLLGRNNLARIGKLELFGCGITKSVVVGNSTLSKAVLKSLLSANMYLTFQSYS